MERNKLKQILIKKYSSDSVKSILSGRMKPSYDVMYELHHNEGIPFTAWKDIPLFIQNNTKNKNNCTTT